MWRKENQQRFTREGTLRSSSEFLFSESHFMMSPDETGFSPSLATKLTRVLSDTVNILDATSGSLLTSMMFTVQFRTVPKDLIKELSEP